MQDIGFNTIIAYIRIAFVALMLYKMGVTFKILLEERYKKKDGSNFLRIRVTHARKSKFITTNIAILPEDLTRSGNIKNTYKLDLVDDLVKRMRKTADGIEHYKLKSMTVEDVVEYIDAKLAEPEVFELDFIEYGLKIADKKKKGTGDVYRTALNALLRFYKGKHPDIKDITVRNLYAFEEFIKNEPVIKVNWRTGKEKQIKKTKGRRAPSQYLGAFRHIYNSARKEYNDPDLGVFRIPNDPFEYYSVPKIPASVHKDIPVEVIQLMIDTRKELTGRVRMAVDAFLISFGLCGINATDMFVCGKVKKSILHYYRAKTTDRRDDGAEMYVKIEPCIARIMKDYKDNERLFDYYKRYANKDVFTTALNQGLRIWQNRYKQQDFTFYAARHSWGTIAGSKRCNIDDRIITHGMNHAGGSNKMDSIYVRFDWNQLYEANAKILGVFDWK